MEVVDGTSQTTIDQRFHLSSTFIYQWLLCGLSPSNRCYARWEEWRKVTKFWVLTHSKCLHQVGRQRKFMASNCIAESTRKGVLSFRLCLSCSSYHHVTFQTSAHYSWVSTRVPSRRRVANARTFGSSETSPEMTFNSLTDFYCYIPVRWPQSDMPYTCVRVHHSFRMFSQSSLVISFLFSTIAQKCVVI